VTILPKVIVFQELEKITALDRSMVGWMEHHQTSAGLHQKGLTRRNYHDILHALCGSIPFWTNK